MAVKKSKFPAKVDKNILQVGEFSFRVRMMHAGHKIDVTLDSLPEAQTYRDLVRANAALDENESRIFESRAKKVESKAFTFSGALNKYREEKSEKKKGWRQEAAMLNKAARWPDAGLPLYQFKSDNVLDLLEWIRTAGKAENKNKKEKTGKTVGLPTSDATLRRYFNLIRHVFQIAVEEWKKIDSNPCLSVPKSARPRDGQGRDRRLQGDEYALMLGQLTGQAKVVFILAVETAMRRGEQLSMRWEHLDLKGRSLRIPETKTDIARTIPLSLVAVEAFKGIEPQGIKGKIISLSVGQLRHEWKRARTAVGAPDLRLHDLRHEATSRLFEKGFGDIEAATVTGHKTLGMLKKYAHLKQEHILEKLDRPARGA